jgi:hypothetical protein
MRTIQLVAIFCFFMSLHASGHELRLGAYPHKNGALLKYSLPNSIAKAVVCFDTVPVTDYYSKMQLISTQAGAADLALGAESVIIDGLAPDTEYYFRIAAYCSAASDTIFSSAHSLHTGAERADYVSLFPANWYGDTALVNKTENGVIFNKTGSGAYSAAVSIDIEDADYVYFRFSVNNFYHNTQNYWGLTLGTDKVHSGRPNQNISNGHHLRIGNANNSRNIELQRQENQFFSRLSVYSELPPEGIFSLEMWRYADDSTAFRFTHCADTADIILASGKYCGFRTDKYAGLYANFNRDTAQVTLISAGKTVLGRHYVWSGLAADASNPIAWQPKRYESYRSDLLHITGDAVIDLKTEYLTMRKLSLVESKLRVVASGPMLNSVIRIEESLTIGENSSVELWSESGSGAQLLLAGSAKMDVRGALIMGADAGSPEHRIVSGTSNSVIFHPGATMEVLKLKGNPFGATGNAEIAIFKGGSSYFQYDGAHPFGLTSPRSKVVFLPGSQYLHFGGGLSLAGRNYPLLRLSASSPTRIPMGGSESCKVDRLYIDSGTFNFTFNTNKAGLDLIIGSELHIAQGARLDFSPCCQSASSFVEFAPGFHSFSGAGNLDIGQYAKLIVKDSAQVSAGLSVDGELVFDGGGMIYLKSANLRVMGNISGHGPLNFIVTDGAVSDAGPYLIRRLEVASIEPLVFPVGYSADNYSPMHIYQAGGAASDFYVRSFSGVYENGLYGPASEEINTLSKTWEVTPSGHAKVDIALFWGEHEEREKFFRDYSRLIINHHEPGDDGWKIIANSEYDYKNGMHSVKAFGIDKFSTVSAHGEGEVLALYYTNMKAEPGNNRAMLSWQQLSHSDSVRIYSSSNAINFRHINSKSNIKEGWVNISVESADEYFYAEFYKNGFVAERSYIIHASASVCFIKADPFFSRLDNMLIIQGSALRERYKLDFISFEGILLGNSIYDNTEGIIHADIPSSCITCIAVLTGPSGRWVQAVLPE